MLVLIWSWLQYSPVPIAGSKSGNWMYLARLPTTTRRSPSSGVRSTGPRTREGKVRTVSAFLCSVGAGAFGRWSRCALECTGRPDAFRNWPKRQRHSDVRLAQHGLMNTDLTSVLDALAALDDGELSALMEATNNVPQIAPGLLAWIESACDWELNRRKGLEYPLQPPRAAIPPEEDAVSVDAAAIIRAHFVQDERVEARGVVVLFDAIVGLLTGSGKRH